MKQENGTKNRGKKKMRRENTFETICKAVCWLLAVILAWFHAPTIGIIACVFAGFVGSGVDLYDRSEDE